MAVILIRHPEPLDGAGLCYGRLDLAPAPGWEAYLPDWTQAARDAARLIASPLARARVPATGLSVRTGLALAIDPAWAEMDFGAWEGLAWDAVPRAELDQWAGDMMGARPHGGETVAELQVRVLDGLAALRALPGDSVVLTHAGPMRSVLSTLQGESAWSHDIPFGTVMRFD